MKRWVLSEVNALLALIDKFEPFMIIIKHRFLNYLNARSIFIYFIYLIHCNFEVSLTDIGFFL